MITNDPDNKIRELVITGLVEKFADISPVRLRMSGKTGKTLVRTIKIKPRKKYPFKITNAVSTNKNILCSLLDTGNSTDGAYSLRVETVQKGKGRYKGKLILTTNSEIKPEIVIEVSGKIR